MKSKLSLLVALALSAGTLSIGAHAADNSAAGSSATGSSSAGTSGSASGSLGASVGDVSASADLSLFQQLDANGDGVVDKKEANKSAQAKSDFKALDANGDGKISADEWAAHASKAKQ